MYRFVVYTLFTAFTVLFTGCSYKTTANELVEFDTILKENKCDFDLVDRKLGNGDDIILWSIQGASLARNCGDFKKSIELFDEAESHYKFDVDLKNYLSKAFDQTRSIFINNNANPYEGNVYEKTLVNTYKALNFLALDDKKNARVEFNRALERQRIASEYFAKDIASLNKKNSNSLKELRDSQDSYNKLSAAKASSEKKGNAKASQISFNEESIDLAVNKYTANINGAIYPDFVNPFTTYMSALFFLNDKSFQRAVDLFRENLQMDPQNQQILKDFLLADKMAGGFNAGFNNHFVWLIYENGFGAIKDEVRTDLPLFLISDSITYTSIALPRLQLRTASYPYLTIINGSGDSFNTVLIADVDSIETAEFNKRYFGIAAETIISAAAKAIIQKHADDIDPFLGFLGTIYQAITSEADIRIWSALPKLFMAASIPIKDGNILVLDENGQVLLSELLQNNKNVIIYVKSSKKGQIIAHKIYF